MTGKKKSAPAILLICATVAILASGVAWMGWLENLETKTVDGRFRLRHLIKSKLNQVRVSDEVVLVGVDQQSVDPAFSKDADRWGSGGWLTRDHWIEPIRSFTSEFKPSVLAYDIILQEYRARNSSRKEGGRETNIDDFLQKKKAPLHELILEEDFPRMALLDLLDEACGTRFANYFYTMDADRAKGRVMPHFITAYYFTRQAANSSKAWDASRSMDREKLDYLKRGAIPSACIHNIPLDYLFADNAVLPFDDLAAAPINLGYIDVPRDPDDGSVRWIPLVLGFRDPTQNNAPVFVPSLALQACLLHLGIPLHCDPAKSDTGISVDLGREIHLWTSKHDIHIPIDRQGRLFLNFEGKFADFLNVPYVAIRHSGEVLQAQKKHLLPANEKAAENLTKAEEVRNRLQNKVALIGLTFTGAGDSGPCGIHENVPYVFIHMTAVDNILRGSFMPVMNGKADGGMIVVLLAIMGVLGAYTRPLTTAVGNVLLLVGTPLIACLLFYYNIICIPIALPGFALLIASGLIAFYRYQTEQKAGIEIRKKFSTMVSDVVLNYLEEHPESFSLAGESREATIFFSDVSGFTSLSEKLPPSQVVKILNAYLGPMSDIIKEHRGCVNKFAGDGIMAFWGAPYPSSDHAVQGCLAALDQQARIHEMKSMFHNVYGVPLKVRMGLNSGVVSAGGMGSADRREYTVMGDAVNFAARLEPTNKDYGTLILIGEKTRELAGDQIEARLLDRIVVQGKTQPVAVYELLGRKGGVSQPRLQGMRLFAQGIDAYWNREWAKALEWFAAVLKVIPDDPPTQVFISRVKECQIAPLPTGWKGEYIRQRKD